MSFAWLIWILYSNSFFAIDVWVCNLPLPAAGGSKCMVRGGARSHDPSFLGEMRLTYYIVVYYRIL